MTTHCSKLVIYVLDQWQAELKKWRGQRLKAKDIVQKLNRAGVPVTYGQLNAYFHIRKLRAATGYRSKLEPHRDEIGFLAASGKSLTDVQRELYQEHGIVIAAANLFKFAQKHKIKFGAGAGQRRAHHLTPREKYKALELSQLGHAQGEIAVMLDTSQSSVYRSIRWAKAHARKNHIPLSEIGSEIGSSLA